MEILDEWRSEKDSTPLLRCILLQQVTGTVIWRGHILSAEQRVVGREPLKPSKLLLKLELLIAADLIGNK